MHSQRKTFASGSVVFLLIAASYLFAIQSEMHLYTSEPRMVHLLSMSVAISKLKYGLSGYVGYNSVLEKLSVALNEFSDNGNPVENLCINNVKLRMCFFSFPSLNQTVVAAIELKNLAHSGVHTTQALVSPGLVDYYSLSFLLFGYQFQSLLYFYFFLLTIQSLIFFLQFRNNDHNILMLILFLVAHYMTLTALRFPGNQLNAPNNYRFLPVLAILPMLHICLLSANQRKVSAPIILGAVAQALLLGFIINCRSSAYWTLVPIALLAVLYLYLWARNRKFIGLADINPPRAPHWLLSSPAPHWWPGLVVFGVVISMGSFYRSQLAPAYSADPAKAGHLFWHNVFVGFASHPDIRLEYMRETASEFYFTWTPDGLVPIDNRTNDHGFVEKIKQTLSWITIQGHANDQFSYLAVAQKYVALGKSPNLVFGSSAQVKADLITFDWAEMQSTVYDHEVGKLVLDVVLKHPILVLEQVFIAKPVLFTWYYLTCYLPFRYECAFWGGRNTHLTEPLSLIVIFLGLVFALMLARKSPTVRLYGEFGILLLSFGGSLIPTLLVYPEPWIIGDAVVALTMCQLFLVFLFLRATLNKAIASQIAARLTTQVRR